MQVNPKAQKRTFFSPIVEKAGLKSGWQLEVKEGNKKLPQKMNADLQRKKFSTLESYKHNA